MIEMMVIKNIIIVMTSTKFMLKIKGRNQSRPFYISSDSIKTRSATLYNPSPNRYWYAPRLQRIQWLPR